MNIIRKKRVLIDASFVMWEWKWQLIFDSFAMIPDFEISQVPNWPIRESGIQLIYFHHFFFWYICAWAGIQTSNFLEEPFRTHTDALTFLELWDIKISAESDINCSAWQVSTEKVSTISAESDINYSDRNRQWWTCHLTLQKQTDSDTNFFIKGC